MGRKDFNYLLSLLKDHLSKKHVIQRQISAELRLVIALR